MKSSLVAVVVIGGIAFGTMPASAKSAKGKAKAPATQPSAPEATERSPSAAPMAAAKCKKPVAATCAPADMIFSPAVGYPYGDGYPNALASGDFNGDGKTDLVVLGEGLVVLLSNGDGTFGEPQKVEARPTSRALVVADFDNDCIDDIVVSSFGDTSNNSNYSLLVGRGDGRFRQPKNYGIPRGVMDRVVASDVNRDGKVDLVFKAETGFSGGIQVILNSGKYTFTKPTEYEASNVFTVADLNGDDAPEIISVGRQLCVNKNSGSGTFSAPVCYKASDDDGLEDVSVGDVNGDGKADVAVALYTKMNLFLGKGDGTFDIDDRMLFEHMTRSPTMSALKDLNGDKRDEYVSYSTAALVGSVVGFNVLMNTNGKLAASTTPFAAGGNPAVAYGDFLGNGLIGMSAANNEGKGSIEVITARCRK